jgi:hypothetical protein
MRAKKRIDVHWDDVGLDPYLFEISFHLRTALTKGQVDSGLAFFLCGTGIVPVGPTGVSPVVPDVEKHSVFCHFTSKQLRSHCGNLRSPDFARAIARGRNRK